MNGKKDASCPAPSILKQRKEEHHGEKNKKNWNEDCQPLLQYEQQVEKNFGGGGHHVDVGYEHSSASHEGR